MLRCIEQLHHDEVRKLVPRERMLSVSGRDLQKLARRSETIAARCDEQPCAD
jgi:hypothetical protein